MCMTEEANKRIIEIKKKKPMESRPIVILGAMKIQRYLSPDCGFIFATKESIQMNR